MVLKKTQYVGEIIKACSPLLIIFKLNLSSIITGQEAFCISLELYYVKLSVRYAFEMIFFNICFQVFFIVRKKFSQVSFLHVYHHCGMVVCVWVGCKYVNGGHSFFIGFANCLVHAFMYLYYLLSIWDERVKKSLWWKKHITQLQIVSNPILVRKLGKCHIS